MEFKERLEGYSSRCLEVLLQHQTEHGSFLASTTYPWYRASWFRDNFWCAQTLNLLGRRKEADRVYRWMGKAILERKDSVEGLLRLGEGDPAFYDDRFHIPAKLNPDGVGVPGEPWGLRQYDGSALFLLGLVGHSELSGDSSLLRHEAVDLSVKYLLRVWRTPCFDVWEEYHDHVHSYTLAACLAGLEAINRHRGRGEVEETIREIRAYLNRRLVRGGVLKKMVRGEQDPIGLDASTLLVLGPFKAFDPRSPVGVESLRSVQVKLGAVAPRRYVIEEEGWGGRTDTYYGGGRWLVLACALGELYLELGEVERAWECLMWCYHHATEEGFLPEQSVDDVFDKAALADWTAKARGPATPLAWSHAAYLSLYSKLKTTDPL